MFVSSSEDNSDSGDDRSEKLCSDVIALYGGADILSLSVSEPDDSELRLPGERTAFLGKLLPLSLWPYT